MERCGGSEAKRPREACLLVWEEEGACPKENSGYRNRIERRKEARK